MLFSEDKIHNFTYLDHGIYLARVSKCPFSLIHLVQSILYVTYRFFVIKLVLYHMHKIYYCLYILEYYRVIIDK